MPEPDVTTRGFIESAPPAVGGDSYQPVPLPALADGQLVSMGGGDALLTIVPAPPEDTVRVVKRIYVFNAGAGFPTFDLLLQLDGPTQFLFGAANPGAGLNSLFDNPIVIFGGSGGVGAESIAIQRLAGVDDVEIVVEWEDEPAEDWNLVRLTNTPMAPATVEVIPAPAAGEVHLVPAIASFPMVWGYNNDSVVHGIRYFINNPVQHKVVDESQVAARQVINAALFSESPHGPAFLLAPGESLEVNTPQATMSGTGLNVIAAYKTTTQLPP